MLLTGSVILKSIASQFNSKVRIGEKLEAMMRKVILGVAVSLDGFIEGPNGEYDWCFTDQDYGLSAFFKRIDTIFMGRKSYEVAQSHSSAGPNPWEGMTTYVFSNTLKEVSGGKNTRLASGDVAATVKNLRQEPGKDMWLFGGAELTTAFINQGLLDEIWVSIHPIVLGAGKPLFQNIKERKNLKLVEHKVYETGLVSLVYQPA
jgi:dihydrofolate reductase